MMGSPNGQAPAFVSGSQASDPVNGPEMRRRAMVDAMMGSGVQSNYSPTANPMEGVSRVAGDVMGGLESNWEQARRAQAAGQPMAASGSPGGISAAGYSNPLTYGLARIGGLFGNGGQ